MVKVRKRPVIVEAEAIQWTGKNFYDLRVWGGEDVSRVEGSDTELQIEVSDGYVFARIGDWIVKGRAYLSVYPPSGFNATYEVVK